MDVFADDYGLQQNHFKKMKEFGMEVNPVDMNGGFVAWNKLASDNLEKTRKNILERFEIEGCEDADDSDY